MQKNPNYDNLVADIVTFLGQRIEIALGAGIKIENIIVDPGIGFGKKLEHNRKIFTSLDSFSGLGVPVLIGHSRKSYLGEVLDRPAEDRLAGTLATSAFLQLEGADILRVHDVKEHFDIRETITWLQNGRD
jgi:dihydropteroate synthase